MKTIELISFDLCPFVQRSVITLLKKGVDFKITYIDLANKPDWFLKISPLGKVPVLRVGDDVLFESAVINEYLDEVTPGSLLPEAPLEKAKARGWIEYSSQVLSSLFSIMVAKNQAEFDLHSDDLTNKLVRLESAASCERYFNGEELSLVDTSIAPVFTRLDYIKQVFGHDFMSHTPKLKRLSKHLLDKEFVSRSVIPEFNEKLGNYLTSAESYLTA